MSLFTREQCLQRLRAQVAAGRPVVGGGAGTGLSAKCAEVGGIDLIILYNSGREEPGMGFGLEVDMTRTAREVGLLTCPYVFKEDEARAMAQAGADVLIPHMGLTTKGTIGARTAMTLDEAARRVQALGDAAR